MQRVRPSISVKWVSEPWIVASTGRLLGYRVVRMLPAADGVRREIATRGSFIKSIGRNTMADAERFAADRAAALNSGRETL